MIEVINVNKSYGFDNKRTHILKDLNFSITKGEIFGVVGLSGVGKSTLLRLLNGLILPDSGQINVMDYQIMPTSKSSLKGLHQNTAFVFQDYNLLFNKTIINNVLLPLRYRKITNDDIVYANKLLNLVGLSDKTDQYPVTLSGGQMQRVAIARALVTKPKIIFFDEPTSALDQSTSLEILDLLLDLKKLFDLTIVIVSHQINIIKYLCDRVAWLVDGKIKKVGKIKKSNLLFDSSQWEEIFNE